MSDSFQGTDYIATHTKGFIDLRQKLKNYDERKGRYYLVKLTNFVTSLVQKQKMGTKTDL